MQLFCFRLFVDALVFPLLDGKLLEGLFICTCSTLPKASEQLPNKQLAYPPINSYKREGWG